MLPHGNAVGASCTGGHRPHDLCSIRRSAHKLIAGIQSTKKPSSSATTPFGWPPVDRVGLDAGGQLMPRAGVVAVGVQVGRGCLSRLRVAFPVWVGVADRVTVDVAVIVCVGDGVVLGVRVGVFKGRRGAGGPRRDCLLGWESQPALRYQRTLRGGIPSAGRHRC